MKRNDPDLFRRLSLSLMVVAVALALQGMRPALAAEGAQVRRLDGPRPNRSGIPSAKPSTQSATVGGRIRYAPEFGDTAIAVPPLADGDGGDTIDCVAGCYPSSRLAALEPARTVPGPEASENHQPPETASPHASLAPRPYARPARTQRSKEALGRLGGSGDWFRRINGARPAEGDR